MWDERYRRPDFYYGTEPNAWLRSQAWRLRPGMRALAVADGEGRNGVWLASQGLAVTTVDGSAVAVEKARALAARHGVEIDACHADLASWTWPTGMDLAVAIYAHLPPELRASVHAQAAACLRPGGLVLLEGFAKAQLGRSSGGPKSLDMLFDPDTLRLEFEGLELVELLSGEVLLDEGPGHQGLGAVVRLVARRP